MPLPSPTGTSPVSPFASKLQAFLMKREQQKPLEKGFVLCPLHPGHRVPLAALVTHLTDLHMGDDLSIAEGAMYSSSTVTRRKMHIEDALYGGLITSIERVKEEAYETKRERGVNRATERSKREQLVSPRRSAQHRRERSRDAHSTASAETDEDTSSSLRSASSSSSSTSSSSSSFRVRENTRTRKRRRCHSHERWSSECMTHPNNNNNEKKQNECHGVGEKGTGGGTDGDGSEREGKGVVPSWMGLPPNLSSSWLPHAAAPPPFMPAGMECEWIDTRHRPQCTSNTWQRPPPPQYPSAYKGPLLPFPSPSLWDASAWSPTFAEPPRPVEAPSSPFLPVLTIAEEPIRDVAFSLPYGCASRTMGNAGGDTVPRQYSYSEENRGKEEGPMVARDTPERCLSIDGIQQECPRVPHPVRPLADPHLPLSALAFPSPSLEKTTQPPLIQPHTALWTSLLSRSIVLQLREEHLHAVSSTGGTSAVPPVPFSFSTPSPPQTVGSESTSPPVDSGRVDLLVAPSGGIPANVSHPVRGSPRENEKEEYRRGKSENHLAEVEKRMNVAPPALAPYALLEKLLLSLRPILDVSLPLPSPPFLSEDTPTIQANVTNIASTLRPTTSPVPTTLVSLREDGLLKISNEEAKAEGKQKENFFLPPPHARPDVKEVAEEDDDDGLCPLPSSASSDAAPSMIEDVMILGSRMIWLYKDEASRKEALRRLISSSGRHFLKHYLKFVS